MPYYPEPSKDKGLPYDAENYWEHVVADYLGISMLEVGQLCIVDYLALRREAFIVQMSKTKEGKEYLENAKAFASTEADYAGLRKELGGG